MGTWAAGLDVDEERRRRLEELVAEYGPRLDEQYGPGSFGCHELLDRASLMGDNIEQYILAHPSCALNPEWYALAEQAVTALRELYQRVGADHAGDAPSLGNGPDPITKDQ